MIIILTVLYLGTTTMKTSILKTTLLSSALLGLTAVSSSAFAINAFTANYQFAYNGKNVGSATRQLSQQGNKWVYKFSAKAGVMASATETSQFTFNNNQVQPLSFSRNTKILVHNRSLSINFNPTSKTINTKKDDKARSFAWRSDALDELNVEIQVREDLKRNAMKSQYFITDAKEVEGRRFVKQGSEKIKTSAGTYDTVKVVIQHGRSDRNTVFWLAPSLDYLPVKVTHKDEDASYSLNLTSYKAN